MKIGFISQANPLDKRSWSGTLYTMFSSLQRNHEVVWIEARRSFIIKAVAWLQRRYLTFVKKKTYAEYHSKLISRLYCFFLTKTLHQAPSINLLFVPAGCTFVAFLKTHLPIIYLSDATFKVMCDYYPEFTNLTRWNLFGGETIERKTLEKAQHTIFSSDWAKQSAINDYRMLPKNISVIEFGANMTPPSQDIVSSKSKDYNPLKLLFVGVDWERKGGSLAVATMQKLNEKFGIPCELKLVGGNPTIPLPKEAKSLGFLNKNKAEDYNKLFELFIESDLFILPTRQECSAIVFCEASAFALPIITFDTGGLANYVVNGINGYRLPLTADAEAFAAQIASLVKSGALPSLSKSARKFYEEKLNWEVWEKKVTSLINQASNQKETQNSSKDFQ